MSVICCGLLDYVVEWVVVVGGTVFAVTALTVDCPSDHYVPIDTRMAATSDDQEVPYVENDEA